MTTTKELSFENSPGSRAIANVFAAIGAVFAIGVVTVCAEPSHDLSMLNALSGQTVRVRDKTGHETKGRVISATATELVLQVSKSQRTMPVSDIERVGTKGDPIWDGAVIGATIGAVAAALPLDAGVPCTGPCFRNSAGGEVVGLLIMAGLGAWWDSRHSHSEVIYQAP
jgi:hypothetical protein